MMIRQCLFLAAILLLFASPVYAHEHCKEDEPKRYSLIRNSNLPHLMPVILDNMGKLQIAEEQEKSLKEIVADVMEPFFAKAGEAMKLEKQISEEILKHNYAKEDINTKLYKLGSLKKEVTDIHIGVINRIKKILTEDQYRMLLSLATEKQKH